MCIDFFKSAHFDNLTLQVTLNLDPLVCVVRVEISSSTDADVPLRNAWGGNSKNAATRPPRELLPPLHYFPTLFVEAIQTLGGSKLKQIPQKAWRRHRSSLDRQGAFDHPYIQRL